MCFSFLYILYSSLEYLVITMVFVDYDDLHWIFSINFRLDSSSNSCCSSWRSNTSLFRFFNIFRSTWWSLARSSLTKRLQSNVDDCIYPSTFLEVSSCWTDLPSDDRPHLNLPCLVWSTWIPFQLRPHRIPLQVFPTDRTRSDNRRKELLSPNIQLIVWSSRSFRSRLRC